MFELEQAIADWRRQMRDAGLKTPAPLDELELHLREEIESQMQSGLNFSQAFEIASRQIGRGELLSVEFGKVAGVRRARLRRLMGLMCIPLVALIVALSACTFFLSGMSVVESGLGFAAVGVTLLIACGWRHAVRFLPVIPNPRRRILVGICGAWGSIIAWFLACDVFANQFLRGLSQEQMVVPVLWSAVPVTILVVLGVGLALGAREREDLGMKKPTSAGA